jgi:PmbA protein
MNTLTEITDFVIKTATELGADQVKASASQGTSTEVTQRDGSIEKWQDSQSRGVSASLLVDDRWSVHSTSDLRPEAVRAFIGRAIEATKMLEPDEHRHLPDINQMGSTDPSALDLDDGGQDLDLRAWVSQLESATAQAAPDGLRSASSFVWHGRSSRHTATSTGFQCGFSTTDYGHGSTMSLEDKDGRLPEAYHWDSVRHHADLCEISQIAEETSERARRRLGSGPAPSRKGMMLLDNRQVGRVIGAALAPMRGSAQYEQRSCYLDKLGQQIASTAFNLRDEPHIERGLASRPFDSDGRPTVARDLFKDGVLQTRLLDIYYARKMNLAPTSGSTSNLVIPPGQRSPQQILEDLDWVIRVEGFLGGNSNPATGRYSFGINGTLFERGAPTAAISEMNITGSIFELLSGFIEAADDVTVASSCRSPSLLFDAIAFSGS